MLKMCTICMDKLNKWVGTYGYSWRLMTPNISRRHLGEFSRPAGIEMEKCWAQKGEHRVEQSSCTKTGQKKRNHLNYLSSKGLKIKQNQINWWPNGQEQWRPSSFFISSIILSRQCMYFSCSFFAKHPNNLRGHIKVTRYLLVELLVYLSFIIYENTAKIPQGSADATF